MNLLKFFSSLVIACGSCNVICSPVSAPPAPPRKCELTLGAWCITEGAFEINRQLAQDSLNYRIWTLRGFFRPESILVVIEPYGCRQGPSDISSLVDFQHGHKWHQRVWDRAQVRLKNDGTCNLNILFPPKSDDPMEWAFPNGFSLIRACHNGTCSDSLTKVFDEIRQRHDKGKP